MRPRRFACNVGRKQYLPAPGALHFKRGYLAEGLVGGIVLPEPELPLELPGLVAPELPGTPVPVPLEVPLLPLPMPVLPLLPVPLLPPPIPLLPELSGIVLPDDPDPPP